MKHCFGANYKNIHLRPLRSSDLEKLRIWRNDKSKSNYLKPLDVITPHMQMEWFNNYLTDSNIYIFSILEKTDALRLIGSVAIYNFRDNRAEIGKIQIGEETAHGKGYGRIALVLAAMIAFERMNIKTLDGSVHQNNIPARTNDLKTGFRIVGEKDSDVGGKEDIIEMTYDELKQSNNFYTEVTII